MCRREEDARTFAKRIGDHILRRLIERERLHRGARIKKSHRISEVLAQRDVCAPRDLFSIGEGETRERAKKIRQGCSARPRKNHIRQHRNRASDRSKGARRCRQRANDREDGRGERVKKIVFNRLRARPFFTAASVRVRCRLRDHGSPLIGASRSVLGPPGHSPQVLRTCERADRTRDFASSH
jgi:hypothetical protein